jgi:mersacidin/lichenicidin family type 2 lantibiotic
MCVGLEGTSLPNAFQTHSFPKKGNIRMKLDIVRAWKDENYRQSLSREQINALPANPAGELTDADLESACGGCEVSYTSEHLSSTALILCEANVFTVNANVLAVPVNLLTGANSNCAQHH